MSSQEAKIYTKGNAWQRKVYKKMSEYLALNYDIIEYGQSPKRKKYKHLLTLEQAKFNFLTEKVYNETIERFKSHKAGDLNRILTNTAASQTYCFNLVIHLNQNKSLADKLFSNLLNKQVKIIHIEPEFTPNMCDDVLGFERNSDESIGDQNFKLGIGTDADIAVFYIYENGKKGILLIEFKFIEAEFSVCSSFKKKNEIKDVCITNKYYEKLIETKNTLCGYNKYFNWELTKTSTVFNINKIKSIKSCPFRLGLNQLWRNILLAEQVSKARACDEFGFWVFSPYENYKYLWKNGKTENDFRNILTNRGNKIFKNITLESILDKLEKFITNENDKSWLDKLNNKYRI